MIFVTVGTLPFERLIKKVDEIAPKIDDNIIMQIGKSSYRPLNTIFFQFTTDFSEMDRYMRLADLVITHGGIGSILKILECKKPAIVIPRNKKYDQVIDNHQMEIVDLLDSKNKIKKVSNLDNLYSTIKNFHIIDFNLANEKSLIPYLKTILNNIDGGEFYS